MNNQFEYHVVDYPAFVTVGGKGIKNHINDLASQGWELISISEPLVYFEKNGYPVKNPNDKCYFQRMFFGNNAATIDQLNRIEPV